MALHRRRRLWPSLLLLLVGLVALAAGLADPLAAWWVRRELGGLTGYRGSVAKVDVQPLRLRCVLFDLKLTKVGSKAEEPLFYARAVTASVDGRELAKARLVADVVLERPKLYLVASNDPSRRQLRLEDPQLAARLEELAAFRLSRLEIREGELTFVDATRRDRSELWVHQVEGAIENVATRTALARGEPTTLDLRGRLQRTGRLTLHVDADPLAKQLTFSGRFALEDLQLAELGGLLAAEAGLKPVQGTLEVRAEFEARDGALRGGLKPVLTNAELEAASPSVVDHLKELLADTGLSIFADRRRGDEVVATVIPIEGDLSDPRAQLWPTILGVVRNAFVQGIAANFANLPPPKAAEKESPLEQARRALSRKRGPPKAQPPPEQKDARPR